MTKQNSHTPEQLNSKGQQTRSVHAGEDASSIYRSSAPDLVMSSSFIVEEELSFSANNLDAKSPFIYTRWGNPTVAQLEQKLSSLEHAEATLAFATGMAATSAVLLGLLSSGDHLVISNTNYPGSAELARETLPRFGIQVTPVDSSDLDKVAQAIQPNTRMIWVETPSNPLLKIADISSLAALARSHDLLLAVDSTFATPIATQPLQLGADLVVHSLTKYIGGHGDAMGGSVSGSQALIGRLKGEASVHYGATISPFNAWLIMRGMTTLPLRMRAHQENALKVANFLEQHPLVEKVFYPGLDSHLHHELAQQQMQNFSGMVSFRASQALELADAMMAELELIHYAVSLGHQRSLIYLLQTNDLASTSYQLKGHDLREYEELAGVGLFRLSVGLEDGEDLCADLDKVFARFGRTGS